MTTTPPLAPQPWPALTPAPYRPAPVVTGPIIALYILAGVLGLAAGVAFMNASKTIGTAVAFVAFEPSLIIATVVALTGALVAHSARLPR